LKVIFLDIDGVLHPGDLAEMTDHDGRYLLVEKTGLFCWAPILERLLGGRDLRIVIHSTWRLTFEHEEILARFPAGLRGRILGMTEGHGRYQSILNYITHNSLTDYVVLDDDVDAFPANWPPLIACPYDSGLSDQRVQAELLNFLERIPRALLS
jgi:hypothetical protein